MTKRDTIADFINKATVVHGNKYNYDNVKYVNSRTKIDIICNKCTVILQHTPSQHLRSKYCMNCFYIDSKNTFIKRSIELYGDKFDYSLINKVSGTNTKVTLICKTCGTQFEQFVSNHIQGTHGCKKCWVQHKRMKPDEYIKRCKEVHGDAFDYSLVKFVNTLENIKILCKKCDTVFEQNAGAHLYHKHKCLKCTHNNQRKDLDKFIQQSKEVHGDNYDYTLVEYINAVTHVTIKCNKCQTTFLQIPRNHYQLARGCMKCNFSKGEVKSELILKNNTNVREIIPQHRFKDCKNKHTLPFDFKVVLTNDKWFLIEYNGQQHYKEVKFFKARNLQQQQIYDKIKYDYCKNNDIPLLVIKYTDYDNIDNIINDFINNMINS